MATQVTQIPTPKEMCENKRCTYSKEVILEFCQQNGGEITGEYASRDAEWFTIYTANYDFTFKVRKGGKFAFYCVVSNKREVLPTAPKSNEHKIRVINPDSQSQSAIWVEFIAKTENYEQRAKELYNQFIEKYGEIVVKVSDADNGEIIFSY